MSEIIDINEYPVKDLLPYLLRDKTTSKNIIWATGEYAYLGSGFADTDEMLPENIIRTSEFDLKPRVLKSIEQRVLRTRKNAEVMTPVWLCNRMNNYIDEQWFGRKAVFNRECEDNNWIPIEDKILFEDKSWQIYVRSRGLEITCGEAPYLASRYDTTTGERIQSTKQRIGILDRKLRTVTENAADRDEWLLWAERAVQSCYGYEFQGDNLLIARINVLLTYMDYYKERWNETPPLQLLKNLTNIITWNMWQMDGLKDIVPHGKQYEENHQVTIFEWLGIDDEQPKTEDIYCKIYDWSHRRSMMYRECKERCLYMKKKLFDFAIGNPPYMEEFSVEGNKTFAAPVYNTFMDAAYQVASKVELVHPARFLFNAGSTPKSWNEKMLNDPHFKVLEYEEDPSKIFPANEIKGGIVISYRDSSMEFGAIGIFTKYSELNAIMRKTKNAGGAESLADIIHTQCRFDIGALYEKYPHYAGVIGSNGKDRRFRNNIFDKIDVFTKERENHDDIPVIGVVKNRRCWRYINEQFVDHNHESLHQWKVAVARANGSGQFGEVLSKPLIMKPREAYTQTFIGIGSFDTENEAVNAMSYLKSKFCRAMLGILKVTQDNDREVWRMVPLQDFSEESDIDWTVSIADIDKQLYRKYGLSREEIDFIEANVKEMA